MLRTRLLAQDKRTQLLQEKYNKDAERHKEKQQEVGILRFDLWCKEIIFLSIHSKIIQNNVLL